MTLPNGLTISRFFLTAAMMAALLLDVPFGRLAALLVFGVAGITDALDGKLARSPRYGVTAFGSLLDPLADKVLVCAAFVSMVEIHAPGMVRPLVPAWVVVLIVSREFLVTGLRLLAAHQGRLISAGPWGKHKTIWQMTAIALLLGGLALLEDILPRFHIHDMAAQAAFALFSYVLSVGVAGITAISGAIYFFEHRDLLRDR